MSGPRSRESVDTADKARAASWCRRCPVRGECLAYALERGIWGGLTDFERQQIR